MTKQKSLKRALISSVLALALCFTMLIGTTYAWFTDSVTSANNVIKSGTLNVELYYADGTKAVPAADSEDWKSANNATIFTYDKWEPGYTDAKHFKIANEGSLAFNYQFAIVPNGEVSDLADVIDVYLYDGTATQVANRTALDASKKIGTLRDLINNGIKQGSLTAGSEYTATIVLKMQESAGNEYQNKTIGTDFDIRVLATQMTYEHDSFGNDYDSMASGYLNVKYSFDDPADLLAFVPAPGASSGLSINSDGEAQIDAPGAWYNFDADLAENQYTVEYDIDITDLAAGENVTVDTGDATTWGSTPIMLERGSTKVYYGNSKNEYLGELKGTVVHVAHTYAYNADNMLEITTIVSDGEASITYSKALASNPETKLYWDIYYATDAGKATMDNFSVSASEPVVDSGAELSALIAEGGDIVLKNDIKVAETLVIPADAKITLDLNGKTISGATAKGNGAILKNEGTLTLVGGTLENDAVNGSYVIENNGTLTLDGATVIGASIGTEGYPDYAIISSGNLTIEKDTNISSDRGTLKLCGDGTTVINGGTFTANDIDRALTSHVVYIEDGATNQLTINGGTFQHLDAETSGGVVINNWSKGVVYVNGGNFSGGNYYNESNLSTYGYGGSFIVTGGTYTHFKEAFLADGYKLNKNDDGTWTVSATKVGTSTDLSAAITNGEAAELTGDVAYGTAINNDATIDLNGNTFEATGTINLGNNADLTMSGGKYEVNGTYGHVDVRPSTAEGSTVTFENVDFSYNKLDPTYGPSTNRLGSVVEVCATTADAKTVIVFKNCTFDNAQVLFEGMSGKTGEVVATFENCTFNALTSSAPIYVQNYVKGTINVIGCTFNLECTSSTASAISVSSSDSTSVIVNAENNTINAVAATPYTHNPDAGETNVHDVKVNGTPANIKFISIGGTTSTATEEGTVKSGIAA